MPHCISYLHSPPAGSTLYYFFIAKIGYETRCTAYMLDILLLQQQSQCAAKYTLEHGVTE